MKKILLLALVMLGGVVSVSADIVKIYFSPNSNWSDASAKFYYYWWKAGETQTNGWVQLVPSTDHSGYYEADFDTDNEGFSFVRINPDAANPGWGENIKWGQTPTSGSATKPTESTLYTLTGNNVDNAPIEATLLPWKYYFMSGTGDTWNVVGEMESSGDNLTYSISGAIYQSKRVGWGPGNSFNSNGSLKSWDNVCKSKTTSNADDWLLFQSYSYNSVNLGSTGSAWYVPASNHENYNDGTITFTFNPSTFSASYGCTKSATISSAGYMTYSNGEKCTISGATAYKASRNNTNTVTLTAMDAATVWPANEGMILKKTGESNTVTISSVAYNATASTIGTNYLIGTGNSTKVFASSDFNSNNIYTFSWDGSSPSTVGFYLAAYDDETIGNNTLAAHKAYLDLSRSTYNARDFLSFSFSDETGINEVSAANNSGVIYNLQGVRQNQLQKGLNIMNGKKVLVK